MLLKSLVIKGAHLCQIFTDDLQAHQHSVLQHWACKERIFVGRAIILDGADRLLDQLQVWPIDPLHNGRGTSVGMMYGSKAGWMPVIMSTRRPHSCDSSSIRSTC